MRILVLLLALSAAACSQPATNGAPSGQIPYRAEAFCDDIAGLTRPLRQTIIFIDETAVAPVTSAAEFGVRNAKVRDLVLSLGDPEQLARGGASEPRERISMFVLPDDGAAPQLLFTGCPPGFSPDEVRALSENQSAMQRNAATFFGTDPVSKAREASEDFETRLLGALHFAASMRRSGHVQPTPFGQSPVARSLAAASPLINLEDGVPRIVLVTDLARFPLAATSETAARAAGFADADADRIDLHRAELHIAGTNGANSQLIADYAEAFFLGARAHLVSLSSSTLAALPPPPARVEVYAGQIDYGPFKFPIRARLAFDRNNALVNSWIVVTREADVATPLQGSATCTASAHCHIASDDSGFSQAWALERGPQPQYAASLPFSGLRYVEINVDGDRAMGRVYDPVVSRVGDAPDLPFEMTRLPNGRL